MRILYVDASLRQTLGHHFNVAVAITDALERQGHTVTIAASRKARGVPGRPALRYDVYWAMKWDPATRRGRFSLSRGVCRTALDLWGLLSGFKPDLIYAHAANAVVCEGILLAVSGIFDSGNAPVLVAELPYPSEPNEGNFYGAQLAALFAEIAQRPGLDGPRFIPITVNEDTSRILSNVVMQPIGTLPSPYSTTRLHSPAADAKAPLRIASLGSQNRSKGFHLLPGILRELGRIPRPVEFVVQIQPGNMDEVAEDLRNLNLANLTVRLVDGDLDRAGYFDLMQSVDIMLLPYEANRYTSAISGIAYEALAQGSVIVAPKETTVGKIVRTYQRNAELFDDWSEPSIGLALRAAIENYAALSQEAVKASARYRSENGPDAYAASLAVEARGTCGPKKRKAGALLARRTALTARDAGLALLRKLA